MRRLPLRRRAARRLGQAGRSRWAARVGLAVLLASGCSPPPGAAPPGAAPPGAARPETAAQIALAGVLTVETVGRGVYGLPVALVFLDADGAPLGVAARDTVDEAGRFRLAAARAPGATEALVIGMTQMEALRIVPRPPGGLRLDGQRTLPVETAVRVALPPAGALAEPSLAGAIPREYGIPTRMLTLSREYVDRLYGGAIPFPLPQVQVELSDRGGFVFQPLDPDSGGRAEIEVNTTRRGFTRSTLAHEYGHYVSYRMWGSSPLRYALRNRDLREGWAVFFSFAARAYAAAQYGEGGLERSNPERAPFTDRFDGPDRRRYRHIAYGRTRTPRAAMGALLWSLYDTAEASPFEPAGDLLAPVPPGPGDNDDLGLGVAVFEAVRGTRASLFDEAGMPEVMREVRRRLSPEQTASADAAAAFFLCPALVGCEPARFGPTPTTATRALPPVSPAGLRAARTAGGLRLAWDRRAIGGPWANAPLSYRIARDGVLVTEVRGTVSSVVLPGAAAGTWSVTAVGDGGLPASHVPTVTVR